MGPNSLVKFLLVAAVFGLTYGHKIPKSPAKRRPLQSCIDKMKMEGIIPACAEGVDTTKLEIVYWENNYVRCGNRLPVNELTNPPKITFHAAEHDCFYVILMFDPDIRIPAKSYAYYLVINVPGSDLCNGRLDNGDEIFYFIQLDLGTPVFEQNDKFIYFVYKQKGKIDKSKVPHTLPDRFHFNPKKFEIKFRLGYPAAAQYHRLKLFISDTDTYIPKAEGANLKRLPNDPEIAILSTI